MTDIRGNFVHWSPTPIDQSKLKSSGQGRTSPSSGISFGDVLAKASSDSNQVDWRISQHAQERLAQRGITLSNADLSKMTLAAKQAQEKGAKDAYMVIGQTGLVVNLPSRTVVTAMNNQDSTIVTQIDSVVFVKGPDHMSGSLPVGDRTIR